MSCTEGYAYCSRCDAGMTNEHAPGHRPGDARPITMELSAAEVDLLRRALRDLRARSRKSEKSLKAKFGASAKTKRAHGTSTLAGTLLRRVLRLCGVPPQVQTVRDYPAAPYVHAKTGQRMLAYCCARGCGCYGARVNTVGQGVGSKWFHPSHRDFLDAFVKVEE